jgi:sulfite reductase (NADPH) flavoprotein alpha-component
MAEDEVWYFAYGSNLNIGQMMNRVGEWIVSKRAVLKGYELKFNVPSPKWGGLTANVVKKDNPNAKVYGALYRISRKKLDVLSTYERTKPTDICVEADGASLQAKVYIFETSRASGNPPEAYLNVMLTGLRQHGYPEAVIKEVKEIASTSEYTI